MTNMKQRRKACRLSQIDVFIGTGIPIKTISLAERGLLQLSDAVHAHIMSFLDRQWNFYGSPEIESKKAAKQTPTSSHVSSEANILRFPLEANCVSNGEAGT